MDKRPRARMVYLQLRYGYRICDDCTLPNLDGEYVSTVSERGSDTGCIHCILNLSARKQPVLYLLYLEQSCDTEPDTPVSVLL